MWTPYDGEIATIEGYQVAYQDRRSDNFRLRSLESKREGYLAAIASPEVVALVEAGRNAVAVLPTTGDGVYDEARQRIDSALKPWKVA